MVLDLFSEAIAVFVPLLHKPQHPTRGRPIGRRNIVGQMPRVGRKRLIPLSLSLSHDALCASLGRIPRKQRPVDE